MKKFLLKLSYTILPLWLAILGLVFCYELIIVPNMQGDLGGLGKIPTKLFYARDSISTVDSTVDSCLYYTTQQIESLSNDSYSIITCGDSFSQLGLYGYQNYMSLKGFNVFNYFPYGPLRWNSIQTAYDLMNLGYVDSTNINVLIIESVERSLYSRLSKMDFTHTLLVEGDEEKPSRSNRNILSEAKIYFDFQVGLKRNENPVKQLSLNKQLFSGTHGNTLYFYQNDVMENGFSIPTDSYHQILSNIDSLFNKAISKGIQLYILICPDKYDLYQDYIVNNPYPRKSINEDFRRIVGNREDIIIGKELLLPYVKNGEKDMYYLDDTHWSYKSSKIIADSLTNIIQTYLCKRTVK